MDSLTYFVAFLTAIVAIWVGYFIGNFFPVFGKAKKMKDTREASGEGNPVFEPFNRLGKRIMDWLLERDLDADQDMNLEVNLEAEEGGISDGEMLEEAITAAAEVPSEDVPAATPVPSTPIRSVQRVDVPQGFDEDSTVLWHDRRTMKIKARIKDEIVDIDDELSQSQHGALSMLLVDLQERVGLTATLRDAIADGTEKAYAETQRRKLVPKKDEEVKAPGFNPLRTIVNYVQSDIPDFDTSASIPEQINVVLQDMIKGTPIADRGVSMTEWPNRGAVFIVGVDVYEDIHKIPDPDVRVAIREAVKKWETTQDAD